MQLLNGLLNGKSKNPLVLVLTFGVLIMLAWTVATPVASAHQETLADVQFRVFNHEAAGPGFMNEQSAQCITNTIGRLPSGPGDVSGFANILPSTVCHCTCETKKTDRVI